MKRNYFFVFFMSLSMLAFWSCTDDSLISIDEESIAIPKKGKPPKEPKNPPFDVDLVVGDYIHTPTMLSDTTITSDAPGEGDATTYWTQFPIGAIVFDPGNGIDLGTETRTNFSISNSNGKIDFVTLWTSDIAGKKGHMHSTGPIPIDPPAVIDPAGFTIHIHKRADVTEFAKSGGGRNLGVVGTVWLGDLDFSSQ